MSNIETPAFLKDASELLSDNGFATSDVWYHGTASGLLASIKEKGLKRSGDAEFNQSVKQTMATIGNTYTETIQPVFLTQSKELAYYWANLKTTYRSQRLGQPETPVVLAVNLSDELKDKAKADAGGAALVMSHDAYIEYVETVHLDNKIELGKLDPMSMDGKFCLEKLGLAYIDKDIPADCVALVSE